MKRAPKAKPHCEALVTFLRLNLGGRGALAALTGTDWKALDAAVHILTLYCYGGDESTLVAFRLVVMKMQPKSMEMAYHAIAYLMDWDNRAELWLRAGLPTDIPIHRCEGEPGGAARQAVAS